MKNDQVKLIEQTYAQDQCRQCSDSKIQKLDELTQIKYDISQYKALQKLAGKEKMKLLIDNSENHTIDDILSNDSSKISVMRKIDDSHVYSDQPFLEKQDKRNSVKDLLGDKLQFHPDYQNKNEQSIISGISSTVIIKGGYDS